MTELFPITEPVLAEAAGWRIRLHELGVLTTIEFEAWRQACPEHEAAWAQVEAPWDYFGDQATAPELIAARGAALERGRRAARARWRYTGKSAEWRRAIIATAAAGVLAVIGVSLYLTDQPATYRTGIAERHVVALPDGSSVSLDSDSEVRVSYSKHARELTLLRGQGRFDVAHDIERPFSVNVGDRRVVATGTSFDVDVLGPEVSVTLIEGHVVVLNRQPGTLNGADSLSGGQGLILEPGERLVAIGDAPVSVQRVNLDKATAWQSGYLVFEDETLGAAVQRINRYAHKRVLIRDPSAAALRFSGVFKTGESSAFIDSLTRYLPIEEKKREDGSVELRLRD
jgi:transmembrane sensor